MGKVLMNPRNPVDQINHGVPHWNRVRPARPEPIWEPV